MKLSVRRFYYTDNCTVGRLSIDGVETGLYTLEPAVRPEKIPGKTAIPSGTYKVIVDFSNHFQEKLPHILDVPNFVGVRIHPGNTSAATEGCILLGSTWDGAEFIGKSRKAFYSVFPKIESASDVTLEVS